MALSKKTATAHNLSRAETFKAAGINDWDVKYAHPRFLGKDTSPEGGTCSLCGQQHLLWLFEIHFDAPDISVAIATISKGISRTEAVTFNPVGSVCITDWLDALPESAEKLAALRRWKIELDKENKAKTAQAIENAFKNSGLVDEKTALARADALTLAQKSVLNGYERSALASIAHRAKNYPQLSLKNRWRSVKAIKLFATVLLKAEAAAKVDGFSAPDEDYQKSEGQAAAESATEESAAIGSAESEDAAIQPTTGGTQAAMFAQPQTETEKLLERGRGVFRDKAKLALLKPYEQNALADIGRKTVGREFVSQAQRDYFVKLVERAEGVVKVDPLKAAAQAAAKTLVERGQKILLDPTKLAALNPNERGALKDMTAKVARYGSFYSDNAKSYYEKLVIKGETGSGPAKLTGLGTDGAEDEHKTLVGTPAPGSTGFVSASGVVGARY